MADIESIYQSYVTYEEGEKSKFIKLRDEQKDAVKEAKDYFEKSADNKRFLWNAKMRFGKTFCAMELAIEMGESEIDPNGKKDSKPISRVLIITHKPVVQEGFATDLKKLQESLKAKGHLKREWGFGTRSEKDDFGNFYDLEKNAKIHNRPYVFFSSTQWLCYSKEVGGAIDDPLRKAILNNDWDLVVIDEAHEGILADRGSVVISKLQECNPKMLYMSGTPFNLLEGTKGFSEEQIYSWDYTEEQKRKKNWNKPGETNPYQELPKMNIFAFNMGTLIPGKDYKKGDMFSFGEMFRTFVGRPEVDLVDGKPYKASKEEIGKFVHESDVKKFLDLMYLGDEKTNYPFTKEQYQENFRHTLWIVPGVKEAKALKNLLEQHELFGSEDFKVVNVAGNSEVDENLNDLGRVKEAIKKYPYTITLSCAKLITGVTVPEWTAVFYMKGSADSSPATYLQTIFRVQSPHIYEENGEKRMKANCYVFDFAPGRSLKVVAATAKFARKTKTAKNKANIITQNDEEIIKEFTTYCPIWQPVVAKAGSSLQPISTDDIIRELNKVYVENIVKNGFDDYNIYLDDEILKLTDDVIQETKDIVDNIPGDNTNSQKKSSTEISDDGGLTTTSTKKRTPKQKQTEKEKWEKEVASGKTTEDFDTWLARKDKEAEQEEKLKKTRKLIHSITKRIPLLMFGAEVDDEKIGINIDNITERIDDNSWNEFMPKGATKAYFKKIKHCYNDAMFRDAGTKIRDWARQTDDMHIEDRIIEIAKIFNYFKNPDKETVLTPWRVVNMHMSQTLGGYCFYDETFQKLNKVKIPIINDNGAIDKDENGEARMVEKELPRLVGKDCQAFKDIFENINEKSGESESFILEINSKTGLYPLYAAYSIYKPLLTLYMREHMVDNPENIAVSEERAIWNSVIKNNIFVICNTDMAVRITYRTLAGYNPIDDVDTSTISTEHYVKGMHIVSDKLIEKATENKESLIKTIKSRGYWEHNNDTTNMKFDAIIGNPPYQIDDDGNSGSATPIYNHFVDMSKELAPSYISLITPSRWFAGGKGLNTFRDNMLKDKHYSILKDYANAKSLFPSAIIGGGVSYSLWDAKYNGLCKFNCYYDNYDLDKDGTVRDLGEFDIFVRFKSILDFLRKNKDQPSLTSIVSARNPFDKPTSYRGINTVDKNRCYRIHTSNGVGYVPISEIDANIPNTNKYKVIVSRAISGHAGELDVNGQAKVLAKIFVANPGEVCTDTYVTVGCFDTFEEAEHLMHYMQTKFVRFLLLQTITSINITRENYKFVPLQNFKEDWTDDKLFEKYKDVIDSETKDIVTTMIKEM